MARPLVPPRHIQVQVRPEAPALDGAPAFLLVCGEGTGVAAPLSRCGFGCGQGRRICISKFTKCSSPLGSDPSPKLQAWLQVESGGGETWTHLQETTLPPSSPPAPSLLSRSCSLSRGLRRAGPNDPPNAPDSRSIHACLRTQQGRPLCKAQSSKPHAQKRKRLRAPWHLLGYSESTQALFSTNGSVS